MSKKTTKKGKQLTKKETIAEQTTDNTLVLTRVIRAPVERVYKAFLDPEALVKWFPPHGFTAKVTEMDVKEGGHYKMSFTNFTTGKSDSFGGQFLELKPHSLIRYTNGTMETIIEFTKLMASTSVKITMKDIPSEMPVEFATLGWQESLQLLEQLVMPEIPDM